MAYQLTSDPNSIVRALCALTPAQAQAWAGANINTLADALATLAIAVSVLSRRL